MARHKWKYNKATWGRRCAVCGAKEKMKKRRSKKNKSKFVEVVCHLDMAGWVEGPAGSCI